VVQSLFSKGFQGQLQTVLKILVGGNPVDVRSDVGVDAGVPRLAAGHHAPGDDAGQDVVAAVGVGADQRAARVTLLKINCLL
jgi:hypothetical protein